MRHLCKIAIKRAQRQARLALQSVSEISKYPETGTYMPLRQLHGFKRVHIRKGKTAKVTIGVPKKDLRYWDERERKFVTPKGEYTFMVGASSEDVRFRETVGL